MFENVGRKLRVLAVVVMVIVIVSSVISGLILIFSGILIITSLSSFGYKNSTLSLAKVLVNYLILGIRKPPYLRAV